MRIMDEDKEEIQDLKQTVKDTEKLLTENQGVKTRFEEWIATNPKPEIKKQILHLDFEKGHGKNASVPGKYGNAVKLTGDDAIGTKVGNFRRFQPFSVSLWMKAEGKMERAVVFIDPEHGPIQEAEATNY